MSVFVCALFFSMCLPFKSDFLLSRNICHIFWSSAHNTHKWIEEHTIRHTEENSLMREQQSWSAKKGIATECQWEGILNVHSCSYHLVPNKRQKQRIENKIWQRNEETPSIQNWILNFCHILFQYSSWQMLTIPAIYTRMKEYNSSDLGLPALVLLTQSLLSTLSFFIFLFNIFLLFGCFAISVALPYFIPNAFPFRMLLFFQNKF